MKRITKPWTPADDKQLAQLSAQKMSSAEIGAIMGRSKNSIIGRANRRGVVLLLHGPTKRKPLPKEQIALKPQEVPVQTKVCVQAATMPIDPKPPQSGRLDGRGDPFTVRTIPSTRCRWIEDAQATADSHMCGEQVYQIGKPWCEHHRAIVFQPTNAKRDPVREAMKRFG